MFMNRLARPVPIIVLFLLAHAVFFTMMLFTFPKINAVIGTEAFDISTLGYSVETAREILTNIDEPTTDLYLYVQLAILDVLYPILLALFLSSWIRWLWRINGFTNSSAFSWLYWFPFSHMLIDYLENIFIAIMLNKGPAVSDGIIQIASMLTITKGLLTTVSWLIIVVLLIWWAVKKLGGRK